MASFDKYSKSVLGKVTLKIALKKYKVLIISVASALAASTGGFFIAENCYTESLEVAKSFNYGETITLNEPHTVLGDFSGYEFYYPNLDSWLNITPTLPGDYKVRAISDKLIGGNKYSNEESFTIEKKVTSINLKSNKTSQVYGEYPLNSELNYSLISGHTIKDQIKYDIVEINNNKIKLLLDTSSIKVIDPSTREDVTSCYKFETVEKELDIVVNNKLNVTPTISDMIYSGNEITYGLLTNGFKSAYGDIFSVLNNGYIFKDNLGNTIDAPKNAGTYYLIINNYTVTNNNESTLSYFNFSNSSFTAQFEITKCVVNEPTQDSKTYEFISLDDSGKQTYNFTPTTLYKLSSQSDALTQNDVGEYDIIIELSDKSNYKWSNGSSDDLYYSFKINKQKVENPLIDNRAFYYNDGEDITYNTYSSTKYSLITENTKKNVGEYEIKYKLNDYTRYTWKDNNEYVNNEYLTYTFKINKKQIQKPVADQTVYTYLDSGLAQTYIIDESNYYTITNNVQTNAGQYPVTVELNDKLNYEWMDHSISNLTFYFTINKLNVEKPVLTGDFVYGETYTFLSYKNGMIIENTSFNSLTPSYLTQNEVGVYSGYLSLDSNHIWANGDSNTQYFSYRINKNKVTKPVADPNTYYYTGSVIEYMLTKNDDIYTITGNKKTDSGETVVTVSLNNKSSYEWMMDSPNSDDLTFTFNIYPYEITAPLIDNSISYAYTGLEQEFSLIENDIDKDLYELDNQTLKFTNAGDYQLTFKIKDIYNNSNYIWKDTSDRNNKTLPVSVLRKEIKDVYQNVSYEFDNTSKSYVIDNTDILEIENKEFVTNITNPTDGAINVTIKIKDDKFSNYKWENTSNQYITKTFEIKKRSLTNPTSNNLVLDYNGAKSYKLSLIEDSQDKDFYNVYLGGELVNSDNILVYNAGTYNVTYEAKYPIYTEFVNTPSTIVFTINKEVVAYPTTTKTSITYTGSSQTFEYEIDNNYKSIINVLSGDSTLNGTNVGNDYLVKFHIENTNYIFPNNTADYIISYSITPKKIDKPTALDNNKFPYDGEPHTYTPNGFDTTWMMISGENTKTNYSDSSYQFNVALIDTLNTVWNDSTQSTDPITFSFKIILGGVDASKFNFQTTKHYYTGSTQSYFSELPSGLNVTYEISGNDQAALADTTPHIVTVTLKPGYKWTDTENSDPKTFDFYIYKKEVEIPTLDSYDFKYTGSVITVSNTIVENEFYYVNNINNKVNVGSYQVKLTLKDGGTYTRFKGNNDSTINLDYVISKVSIKITSGTSSKVYDGLPLTNTNLPSTIDGLLAGDTVTINTNASLTHVGEIDNTQTYIIKNSSNDDVTANYNITTEFGKLKVTPKPITVNIYTGLTNDNMEYGTSYSYDTDHIYTGFVDGSTTYKITSMNYYTTSNGQVDNPVNAGTYKLVPTSVTLNSTVETIDDYDITYSDTYIEITKAPIGKPSVDPTVFTYDGSELTYNVASSSYYTVTGNKKTESGNYKVIIALDSNHKWSDDTTSNLEYDFNILKLGVNLPTSVTNLEYTGSELTLLNTILGYDSIYSLSQITGINAGKYNVTVSLVDKTNFYWIETSNNTNQEVEVTINKKKVLKPTEDTKSYSYNGENQTYSIITNDGYIVTGDGYVQKYPGTYKVTYKLNSNYIWEDNKESDITYNFKISKRDISIDMALFESLTYNEGTQTVTPKFIVTSSSLVTGDSLIATSYKLYLNSTEVPYIEHVGTYTCEVGLSNIKIYNGGNDQTDYYNITTLANNTRTITVNKLDVEIVLKENSSFVFDDKSHTASDLSYNYYFTPSVKNLSITSISFLFKDSENEGLTSIKNVGEYKAKINSLTVNNTLDYNVTYSSSYSDTNIFTITYKEIKVPTIKTGLIYDGTEQILLDNLLENYENYYTITNGKGTNAGTYSNITITLKPNYAWLDLNDENKLKSFKLENTISKRVVNIQAEAKEVDFLEDYSYGTTIADYNITGDAILDSDINNITITVGYKYGDSIVTPYNAQTYTVYIASVTLLGTGDNYTFNSVDSTLKINKIEVAEPNCDEITKEYNNTDFYNTFINKIPTSTYYNITADGFTECISADEYAFKVSLVDKNNLYWDNFNGTADRYYYFTISKKKITIPTYTEKSISYDTVDHFKEFKNAISTNSAYAVTAYNDITTAISAGTYSFTVKLNDKTNYCWSDNTTSDITVTHKINKKVITIPTYTQLEKTYDGSDYFDTFTNAIPTNASYTVIANNDITTAINVGTYSFTISLIDTDNTIWSNNTTSDITVTHKINKQKVTLEYTIKSVEYNKENRFSLFNSAITKNDSIYTVTADGFSTAINVGEYDFIVSLKNTSNYCWSDESIENITVTHKITPIVVASPAGLTNPLPELTLTKSSLITPSLSGPMFNYTESDYYHIVVKDSKDTIYDTSLGFKDSGTYIVQFVLNDSTNTVFDVPVFGNNKYTIKVNKCVINNISNINTKYTSDPIDFLGSMRDEYADLLSKGIISYDNSKIIETNAGNYNVEFKINDDYLSKFEFTGGVSSYTLSAIIAKATLTYRMTDVTYEYTTDTFNEFSMLLKSINIIEADTDYYQELVKDRKNLIDFTCEYDNDYYPASYDFGKFNCTITSIGAGDDVLSNYEFVSLNDSFVFYKKAPTMHLDFYSASSNSYGNPYDFYYLDKTSTKIYPSSNLYFTRTYNSEIYSISGSFIDLGTYTLDLEQSAIYDSFGNNLIDDITFTYGNGESVNYSTKRKIAVPYIEANDQTLTYNGQYQSFNIKNAVDSIFYSSTFTDGCNSGTYNVEFNLYYPGVTEWNGEVQSYTVTINKAPLTVTLNNISKEYNDTTYIVSGTADANQTKVDLTPTTVGLKTGDTLYVVPAKSVVEKEPGVYTVNVTYVINNISYGDVTSSYDFTPSATITFTITPKSGCTINKPINSEDTIYDGTLQDFVLNVADSSKYDISKNATTSYLEAGTYSFDVYPKSGYVWSGTLDRSKVTVTWTIKKKDITLVANGSNVFDGLTHNTIPSLTVVTGALASTDSITSFDVYMDSLKTEPLSVYMNGTYKTYLDKINGITIINNNTDVTDSYNITVNIGKYTVTKASLTITCNDTMSNTMYNGEEITYTGNVTTSGLIIGHQLEVEFDYNTNVGTYKTRPSFVYITDQDNEDITNCYAITYVTTTYSITQNTTANVEIIVPDAYENLGDRLEVYELDDFIVTGLVGNDEISSIIIDDRGSETTFKAFITGGGDGNITKNYANVNIHFND